MEARHRAGQRVGADRNLRRRVNQRCIHGISQRNRLGHLLVGGGRGGASDERKKADAAGWLIVIGKVLEASGYSPVTSETLAVLPIVSPAVWSDETRGPQDTVYY